MFLCICKLISMQNEISGDKWLFIMRNFKNTKIINLKKCISDCNFCDIDKHQFLKMTGIYWVKS